MVRLTSKLSAQLQEAHATTGDTQDEGKQRQDDVDEGENRQRVDSAGARESDEDARESDDYQSYRRQRCN